MPKPERRTRADLLAVAVITIVVIVIGGLIWWRSPERATTSQPAQKPVAAVDPAVQVPTELAESWRAPSPATALPTTAAGVAVTADNGTVQGRDRRTGRVLWKYQRDIALCGVVGAWGTAVSVYRDARGCSEVTAVEGDTGRRGPQRSSLADHSVVLSTDGTYVVSFGSTRLELWRSDLVRTLEYGRVDAPVSPGAQPRSGCTLRSAQTSPSRLAVVEDCPGDAGDRLSALAPAPKDASKPEVLGSNVLTDAAGHAVHGARVVAVSDDDIALYLPGPDPALAVYDGQGDLRASYPMPAPDNGAHVTAAVDDGLVYTFWTGSATVALNATDLSPRWQAPGTLGPGAAMAGSVIVPVPSGIDVYSVWSGDRTSTIALSRPGYGPGTEIGTAVLGDTVLELRGAELVALEPRKY